MILNWRRAGAWNLCGLMVVSGVAVAPPLRADEPASEKAGVRWGKHIRRFEQWDRKNTFPQQGVLFVGSSSIVRWPTRVSFPELAVVNRGFGGSQISDVNDYVDRIVTPYRPRVIVFYAGDNDIAAGETPQQVLKDYMTFVGLIHAALPKTRIIFLAIKPSLSRWNRWPQMREANELIRQFTAGDERLEYLDLATPMLGADGKPRPDLLASDGLHLSEEGYTLWTEQVRPLLASPRN